MTNILQIPIRKKLEREIKRNDFIVGIYDDKLDSIDDSAYRKIIENMFHGSTDILININRKKYIVEVSHVDNEIDFNVMELKEYEAQYGRKFQED